MPHSFSILRHRGKQNSSAPLPPSSGSDSDSAVGMTSAIKLVHDDHGHDDVAGTETSHLNPSQPPSPTSNPEYEDEDEDEDGVEHPTLHTRHSESIDTEIPRPRRHSVASSLRSGGAASAAVHATKSTHDNTLDIPLAVAIIPPLGSLLIGGNFAYDFLLLLLMFFYLHQLIKLPWELYLASRPRRVARKAVEPGSSSPPTSKLAHDIPVDIPPHLYDLYTLAESELKTAEFVYLSLSVLSPLIGAALLRYVCTALAGRDYISWFSTGVFVLVTGIRPWGHLSRRLRERTEELQETVMQVREYDGSMTDEQESGTLNRIEVLENAVTKSNEAMEELKHRVDAIDPTLNKLAADVKHQLWMINERVEMLESMVRDALSDVNGKSVGEREKMPTGRRSSLSSNFEFGGRSGSRFGNLGERRSGSHAHVSRTDKTSWRTKSLQLRPRDQHRSTGSVSGILMPPTFFRAAAPPRHDNYLSPSHWLKFVIESALEAILNLVALCFGAGRRWVLAFGVFVKRSFA